MVANVFRSEACSKNPNEGSESLAIDSTLTIAGTPEF